VNLFSGVETTGADAQAVAMVTETTPEECPRCGWDEDRSYALFLENNRVVGVAPGTNNLPPLTDKL